MATQQQFFSNYKTVLSTTTTLPHFHQLYRELAAQHASAAAYGLHATIDPASAAANISQRIGANESANISGALTRHSSATAVTASGNSAATPFMHMRLALTITHLLLVSLGTVNLLVIFIILLRPIMRSITNVYMLSLCLADFIYLTNLSLVAATQLNDKFWSFGEAMCVLYHGSETTGKYASVLFVVLLAVDRYYCMCRSSACARYRNFRVAIALSLSAWAAAIIAAFPLYYFADVMLVQFPVLNSPYAILKVKKVCIAKWPNSDLARWYITVSSVLIFALPLVLIIYCYYHILNKMREALKRCKRMRRGARFRAPYHRVTRLVLWVVVFHVICWSPFWLFNLFTSIFRLRITTEFDRIVINIIHLFPYVNCALNPLLYMANADNFRVAFRSLFCGKKSDDALRCVNDGATGGGGALSETYGKNEEVNACCETSTTHSGKCDENISSEDTRAHRAASCRSAKNHRHQFAKATKSSVYYRESDHLIFSDSGVAMTTSTTILEADTCSEDNANAHANDEEMGGSVGGAIASANRVIVTAMRPTCFQRLRRTLSGNSDLTTSMYVLHKTAGTKAEKANCKNSIENVSSTPKTHCASDARKLYFKSAKNKSLENSVKLNSCTSQEQTLLLSKSAIRQRSRRLNNVLCALNNFPRRRVLSANSQHNADSGIVAATFQIPVTPNDLNAKGNYNDGKQTEIYKSDIISDKQDIIIDENDVITMENNDKHNISHKNDLNDIKQYNNNDINIKSFVEIYRNGRNDVDIILQNDDTICNDENDEMV